MTGDEAMDLLAWYMGRKLEILTIEAEAREGIVGPDAIRQADGWKTELEEAKAKLIEAGLLKG